MSTKTRLSTYATLAAAGTGAVVGAADAAIISSSALNGKVINWNLGAGNVAATNVTVLAGQNAGFTLFTRATAAGGGSNYGYGGVVLGGFAPGGGGANMEFLRTNTGTFPFLIKTVAASYNAGGAAASLWQSWGNINVGPANNGPPGAAGAAFSPGTSKYVMFRFNNNGTTNYGWIELKAATTGFSGTSQYSVTLGDWAYDNTGAALGAGVTANAVPGLGGLAALAAMGAAGVRTRRQR
jgi:hypothetical protein